MIPDNYGEIILRLVLSVLLGGVIGTERAGNNHAAGLRTHIVVCLGSAGIMVMSNAMAAQYNCDVGRLGAQVISGIGFLGAGCILVNGKHISGLTTAAGLWTTACIGLAVGMGYYFISTIMAVLMMIAMFALRPISSFIQKKDIHKDYTLRIYLESREDFEIVNKYISNQNQQIISISIKHDCSFTVKIANETESDINQLICGLMESSKINKVERV